ncbi:hypothetical protein JX265_014087 [Neoarthrinium moseri]|uniref:Uncharacterized protein n=1 Tax=Neoarthrinium moseri TaxID=1658444 RepID=A0A9Q0AH13_9PEZI|nr:hypothetical protein JX265_014087 [Neoarthrinium moseri]
MRELQEKIDRLKSGDTTAMQDVAVEWQALLEEKESTKQGLSMCAQLSSQIAHFESTTTEHAQFSPRQSARKHIQTGLGKTRESIQSLVARLQRHEALLGSQLEAMSLNDAFSEPVATQLTRLQQTKDSVSQCIQIVSEAGKFEQNDDGESTESEENAAKVIHVGRTTANVRPRTTIKIKQPQAAEKVLNDQQWQATLLSVMRELAEKNEAR